MRYPRNTILEHYSNANGSEDMDFKRDLILDEIAFAIKKNPKQIIQALRNSKVKISENSNNKTIGIKLIDNIYTNQKLKKEITLIIAKQNSKYSNTNGDKITNAIKTTGTSTAAGASGGGVAGGIIGAIGGITQSVFDWKTAESQAQTEKLKAQTALMDKLSGGSQKKWLPIVIVGGVLVIGAIVIFFTLKKK
tara:strand:+ start:5001 stop:5579 length:579 start_codon:yes stop_codon:yes gene_type:complete